MSEVTEDALYYKILDMKIILRDVHYRFQPYSSTDVKNLITSKMKSLREPGALKHLYTLEKEITQLRLALEKAKEVYEN
jgi:hypothetical protein